MQEINAVLQRLIDGNRRFVADKLDGRLQDSHRRLQLASRQQPYAIILGCADSRVVPELAFDTGLGELFVVRVAGNVANRSSIASIEFGVSVLKVRVIVVLGHEDCGAVTAALDDGEHTAHLIHLLGHIEAAGSGGSINQVMREHARMTAVELVEDSDVVRSAVEAGELKVIPAYYEIASGRVVFLDD